MVFAIKKKKTVEFLLPAILHTLLRLYSAMFEEIVPINVFGDYSTTQHARKYDSQLEHTAWSLGQNRDICNLVFMPTLLKL